jgi:NADH:ubiquinone oxidoreductase subunit F (NADH-binding)
MLANSRVLSPEPVTSLAEYRHKGGKRGFDAALEAGPEATLAVVDASGLLGRGGAGFPTGTKWRTVAAHLAEGAPPTVVVNAAEGEPGTFKDRAILRADPYRVLEGALIAATVVGADTIVVATKKRFTTEISRLRAAVEEIASARWSPITIDIVQGPAEYLYGEETALLEVIAGRHPFPRVAPPWRRGIDDDASVPADAPMAAPGGASAVAPVLVNNVETLANVALIVANGPEWFRDVGPAESPGTIVCTVTGATKNQGVVEVAMGTPLGSVIEAVGEGARQGSVTAVMPGVSNAALGPEHIDTPLTYAAMQGAGSGLGTGGFIVFDETIDPVGVALGASRFLAVESCGQCTPCKQDGLAIARALAHLGQDVDASDELNEVAVSLSRIEDGARCSLAAQHRLVVSSLVDLFPEAFANSGGTDGHEPYPFVELLDLIEDADGTVRAVYDEDHRRKQPDWTFDEEDSGRAPADRLDQSRALT